METKQYQKHSLHWLRRYYQKCRMMQAMEDSFPASTAFTAVTAEIHEGQGLPFAPVKQVPGIHGFYGASSMERLPTETALTETTRRFMQIGR